MGAAGNTGLLAGEPEPCSKALLHHRPAALSADEGEIAGFACVNDSGKFRQKRDYDRRFGLFRPERDHAVFDMLASQLHDVAAPETGKEQQCERQSFPRADRPACLKAFDFRIRPAMEALGFRTKAAYPFRWIALDVARFKSPAEQSAHAFQKINRSYAGNWVTG